MDTLPQCVLTLVMSVPVRFSKSSFFSFRNWRQLVTKLSQDKHPEIRRVATVTLESIQEYESSLPLSPGKRFSSQDLHETSHAAQPNTLQQGHEKAIEAQQQGTRQRFQARLTACIRLQAHAVGATGILIFAYKHAMTSACAEV